MTSGAPPPSSVYYDWIDVGQPPSAVLEWKNARLKRFTPLFAALGAAIIGPLAGFAATALWPGAQSWSLNTRLELFAGVAIVVAAAEFVGNLRLIPWIARLSTMNLRRVAISGEDLHVELVTGRPFDYPLKRLSVSREPIASGWYSISMQFGKVTATAFVPPAVQRAIAERLPPA